jgi:integrase
MDAAERNRALCAAWLERQGRRCVPLTVRQYSQRLDKLLQFAGPRPLGSLTLRDLEAWTHAPTERAELEGRPKSDGTISRDVVIVRGLYKWAVTNGLITANPAAELQPPMVRNHNPRAIPDDTWRAVWFSELSDDMRVCLGLGYYCGLRREEMCRLTAQHWDQRRGRLLHFKRKGDRNSKTTGVVPVTSCAQLYAEKRPDLLADPDDFLRPLRGLVTGAKGGFLLKWGNDRQAASVRLDEGQTNPDQINSRVVYMLRRLRLPERAFTPHALRHSFVTNLLDMGVPLHEVSALANHSTLAITARYIKVADDPLARYLSADTSLVNKWPR